MSKVESQLKTGFETSMAAGFGTVGAGVGGMPFRRSPRSMATYPYSQLKFQPNPFGGQPMHKVPATAAGIQQVQQAKLGSFPESFFCGLCAKGLSLEDFSRAIKQAGALIGTEAEHELQEAFQKLAGGWGGAFKGFRSQVWNAGKSMVGRGAKAAPVGGWTPSTFGQVGSAAAQTVKPTLARRVGQTAGTAAASGALSASTQAANADPNSSWGDTAKAFGYGALGGGAARAVGGQGAGDWVRRHSLGALGFAGLGSSIGAATDVYDQYAGRGSGELFRADRQQGKFVPADNPSAARTGFNVGLGAYGLRRFLAGRHPAAADAVKTVGNVANGVQTAANSGWSTLRKGLGYGAGLAGLGTGVAAVRDPGIIERVGQRVGDRAVETITQAALANPEKAMPFVDRLADKFSQNGLNSLGGKGAELFDAFGGRAFDRVMSNMGLGQFVQPMQNLGQTWSDNKEWLAPMLLQSLLGAGGGYMLGGGEGAMAGALGLPALIQGAQYMSPDYLGDPAILGALKQQGLTGGEQQTLDTNQQNLVQQLLQGLGFGSQTAAGG